MFHLLTFDFCETLKLLFSRSLIITKLSLASKPHQPTISTHCHSINSQKVKVLSGIVYKISLPSCPYPLKVPQALEFFQRQEGESKTKLLWSDETKTTFRRHHHQDPSSASSVMVSMTKESISCLDSGQVGASSHLSGLAPTCEINTYTLSDTFRPPASKIISQSQQKAAAAA